MNKNIRSCCQYMTDSLGKDAESRIRTWLDAPALGISFDRIPDQMTGFYGSKNICDFTCFKSPYLYYIESKATWKDRFDFTMITDTQRCGLLSKSKIPYVMGIVIVLFAGHKRAFMLNIQDIQDLIDHNTKSLNVSKMDKWQIPYVEIPTIDSRKNILDYTGDINQLSTILRK